MESAHARSDQEHLSSRSSAFKRALARRLKEEVTQGRFTKDARFKSLAKRRVMHHVEASGCAPDAWSKLYIV